VAAGFTLASARLHPRRLRWAAAAVRDRYATGREWLLVTTTELGVLVHLPADPARCGFTVAALTRPFPINATRIPTDPAPAAVELDRLPDLEFDDVEETADDWT
jgi:hypothetical protein